MRPVALIAALCTAPAAFARADLSGDPAAGEAAFQRCATRHVVMDDAGEALAGRGARTGPNLHGVALRRAGAVEGFRCSDDMVEAGERGLVWDEANFVPYVQDPTGHLREVLDDPRARGKMTYELRNEQEAHDLYAYLVSIGPELPEEERARVEDASSGGDG